MVPRLGIISAIVKQVHDKGFTWDAYDQGRWAFWIGIPLNQNPHLDGHSYSHDWKRGWQREACVADFFADLWEESNA
jgi:hypothetical protein